MANGSGAQWPAERLTRLRRRLAQLELDALLVFSPANRRYLSGFTGTEGFVLIGREGAIVLVDPRYTEQARGQCPAFTIVEHNADTGFWPVLERQLAELGVRRLGFEGQHVTVAWLDEAREKVPAVNWVPTQRLVEQLRMIKDEGEIAAIRRAQELTDRVFAEVLAGVRAGMSERELALRLWTGLLEAGAEDRAFVTIVASGVRSALPHGVASDKPIERGDLVTVDFGAYVDGYASDMTRTFVVGRASPEQRRIYDVVLQAEQAGVEAVRPGRTGKEVDAVARAIIEQAGYGQAFGHGLGHGVGLEVHEAPRLSKLGEDRLEPGMVVTVEPGIYLPGWGGVRIEDLVVVREDGPEVLTQTPKQLLEL